MIFKDRHSANIEVSTFAVWRLISPVVLRNQFVNDEGFVPHRPTV
jgi:hypothetical protein